MNNLMRRSGIIAVLCMLLCLCLLVCSCGGNGGDDETTPAGTDPVTDPIETDPVDTDPVDTDPVDTDPVDTEPVVETVTYTVTVKNEAGVGIAGVGVQLCAEQCHPAVTNASGVATFTLPETVYQAGITGAVSGYVVDTSAKYDFAAGATSLEIVLKAAAPAPTEGAIDLKNDENAVKGYEALNNELMYVNAYIAGEESDTALGGYAPVEVLAGDSVVYTYEATADGYIVVYMMETLGAKTTVTNITTGTQFLPLSGVGLNLIPVTAGNTYEVKVNYTLSEKVFYLIAGAAAPDGSKDAPYYLTTGTVAMDVVIPEGETVWFIYDDSYLLIEDASVKVNIDGVLYAPNAQGNIDNELLGLERGTLIGVSSSVADDKVVIKLTGSDPLHPLMTVATDSYMFLECNAPAWTTVYMSFPNGYAVVIENAPAKVGFVSGTTVVSKIYTTNATSLLSLYNGTDTDVAVEFSLTDVSTTAGITPENPITVEDDEMIVDWEINPDWDKNTTVDLKASDYKFFFNEAGETVVFYSVLLPYGEWNVNATVNGNNVVVFQSLSYYESPMSRIPVTSYDFEEVDGGFATSTPNGGNLLLMVVVKDATCKLEISYEEIPPKAGSQDAPIAVEAVEGATTVTFTATKEIATALQASYGGYQVNYTFTATEACSLTFDLNALPQVGTGMGSNGVGIWKVVNADGTESYDWNYNDTMTELYANLNEGATVYVIVTYGDLQVEDGSDLVITATLGAPVVTES